MKINLKKIPKDRVVAVQIPDKDCAEVFLSEMKDKYPRKVGAWDKAIFEQNYHNSGGVCYIPHFETEGGMTHWSLDMARRRGYQILNWIDVLDEETVLETGFGDLPIEALFG